MDAPGLRACRRSGPSRKDAAGAMARKAAPVQWPDPGASLGPVGGDSGNGRAQMRFAYVSQTTFMPAR